MAVARRPRVEYPGAFYHVVNRGNAGESIFRSKRDREKLLAYLGQGVSFEAVATEFGCDKDSILLKGHKKNAARDVAIYLAREMTGESGKKLGERFGGISGSGVTMQ